VKYESEVLERYAETSILNAQRLGIAVTGVFLFFGIVVAGLMEKAGYELIPTACLTCSVGIALGALIGVGNLGRVRVQVQLLLCSVEQEKHLRRIANRE